MNYKSSKVVLSIFSWKTFLFTILTSLPFVLQIIWMCFYMDYIMEVLVQSATEMYSIMDIACICVINFCSLTPCTVWIGGLSLVRPWVTVPELSMDKSIQFPRNFRIVLIILFLQIIREEGFVMTKYFLYEGARSQIIFNHDIFLL